MSRPTYRGEPGDGEQRLRELEAQDWLEPVEHPEDLAEDDEPFAPYGFCDCCGEAKSRAGFCCTDDFPEPGELRELD